MFWTIRRDGIVGVVGLSMLLSVLPACSAVAGDRQPSPQVNGSNPSGNIVYRPVYPGQPRKDLYLSGYAGATYPPLGAGPALEPTGYSTRPRRSLFHFGQGWWGH